MNLRILLSFISLVGLSLAAVHPPRPLHRSMIEYINNIPGNTWKAGVNFKGFTLEEVSRRCGAIESEMTPPTRYHSIPNDEDLPEHFDSREQWPECHAIGEIRDQGNCGSCWAFAAVTAFEDRICIASEGKIQVHLAAMDILTCCIIGEGCLGGDTVTAWNYFVDEGVVTGGSYGSNEGCLPYMAPPCEHVDSGTARPKCNETIARITYCRPKCREGYNTTYKSDKHYATGVYRVPQDPRQIMKEVMTHGPVAVSIEVYEDFFSYQSGVYQHVTGEYVGSHAVKLIGWGVEGGVDYWLLANSWNTDFGDNGFVKVLRGVNHIYVERKAVGGIPKM